MIRLTRRKLYAFTPEGTPRNSVIAFSKYKINSSPTLIPEGTGYSKRITIDFWFFDLKIQWVREVR